jgi:hypothetical protein
MSDVVDYERTDRPWTAQPPPVHVPGAVSVHDLVIADVTGRKNFGFRKHGTLLQVDNGRDSLQDTYEEILDAACYLRQEIERRKRRAPTDQVGDPPLCTVSDSTAHRRSEC